MLFNMQVRETDLFDPWTNFQSDNLESEVFSGPEQLKNTTPEAECSQEGDLENTREDSLFFSLD